MDKKIKVSRVPSRGHYDKETIYRILDANFYCHVGFVHEKYPVVIPTAYGRKNDELYIHGSTASRMVKDLSQGVDVCVTVSKVNGLVLAKSGFHHSMNYESVVVFGKAVLIEGKQEKLDALEVITNHIIKDRWDEVRETSDKELKGTVVLKLSLDQASAKIRDVGVKDDKEDLDLPIWSGVIPIDHIYGTPWGVDGRVDMPNSVLNLLKLKND